MKKIATTILLLCLSISVFAQTQKLKNLPYADLRRFHYGFCLGLSLADITFQHNGTDWYAECPEANPAFSVGLLGDLALTENLSLRCQPSLHFISRNISFRNQLTTEIVKQNLKSCIIEIPLSIKVATKRLNNYRPYLSAGFSTQYDLAHAKETPIVFNHFDISLHIALGCDTYLPFFKFVPELRFNLGLLDMLDHVRKDLKDETLMPYTDALSSAKNKYVSLIFYFE
ncbi:MAG: PorT family protein [Bacteroidales bacterium]|nr:PorT family protein [Bacteroidales bacterium]